MTLYHVSENGSIGRFEPRLPPIPQAHLDRPVVWAVDDAHLVNYLVPRECPRVAFRRAPSTTRDDANRYLGDATVVLAIESLWLERVQAIPLWVYSFNDGPFHRMDATAGYYVAFESIEPQSKRQIQRPFDELAERQIELRVMDNLQALAHSVADSSLAFSCIRMRNAQR